MRSLLRVGILLGLCLLPSGARAEGSEDGFTKPTYREEGDVVLPFNVECDSNTWTVVQSSDVIRRSILMYAPHDNPSASGDGVCLSTITTANHTCTASTAGAELRPGASLTDYSRIRWNCRGRANNASLGRIKGYVTRDSRDVPRVR